MTASSTWPLPPVSATFRSRPCSLTKYGHQLNTAHDNFPAAESAEMGPDAYVGYFLAHPRGDGLDSGRLRDVAYYDAADGDCAHSHGTPQQRMGAGAWGENLATGQADPDRIMPSATVVAQFKAEFPKLVPPAPADHNASARG